MANVTPERERGQIILVMGLVIAVALILLTVLLNGLIYSDNLASRGTGVDGGEAIETKIAVADATGELLSEVNDLNLTVRGDLRSNVSGGLQELNTATRLSHAKRGVIVNVSNVSIDVGAVLRQNDSARSMVDEGGDQNWTLAEDVSDTRRFELNITGGLDSSDDPQKGYQVVLTGSNGDRWKLFVYSDGSSPKLAVKNGTGSVSSDICGPLSTPLVVNLTAGTVNGTPCSTIELGKDIDPPYDVEYVFGNRSKGAYQIRINVSSGNVRDTNFNDTGSNASPFRSYTGYSLRFDVLYATDDLRYRSRVRVVPSEFA